MKTDLEKAKELICEYYSREFGIYDESNFSDLTNVGLAYTTLTDYEIPIQVSIDLINMQLKTWIGMDDGMDKMEPEKIEEITLEELDSMSFDDFISGWQFYIEDNLDKYL